MELLFKKMFLKSLKAWEKTCTIRAKCRVKAGDVVVIRSASRFERRKGTEAEIGQAVIVCVLPVAFKPKINPYLAKVGNKEMHIDQLAPLVGLGDVDEVYGFYQNTLTHRQWGLEGWMIHWQPYWMDWHATIPKRKEVHTALGLTDINKKYMEAYHGKEEKYHNGKSKG